MRTAQDMIHAESSLTESTLAAVSASHRMSALSWPTLLDDTVDPREREERERNGVSWA